MFVLLTQDALTVPSTAAAAAAAMSRDSTTSSDVTCPLITVSCDCELADVGESFFTAELPQQSDWQPTNHSSLTPANHGCDLLRLRSLDVNNTARDPSVPRQTVKDSDELDGSNDDLLDNVMSGGRDSCLSVCLVVLFSVCLHVWLLVCLPCCLVFCLSACVAACLSASLSCCLSVCVCGCLSVCLVVLLSVCLHVWLLSAQIVTEGVCIVNTLLHHSSKVPLWETRADLTWETGQWSKYQQLYAYACLSVCLSVCVCVCVRVSCFLVCLYITDVL